MDVLQDFLNTYTPTEVGRVEIVEVKEEPGIKKPDEVKVEVHVKIEPVQVDLPETAKQPPAPPNDSTTVVLEDVGRLTEVGKVPIIDDEHMVNLANQTLGHKFAQGQRVRYSYVERDDMRKDILILECGMAEEQKVEKVDKPIRLEEKPSTKKEEPPIEPKSKEIPIVTPQPFDGQYYALPPSQDDQGLKQWKGTVKVARTVEDLSVLEVHFENGSVEVVQITAENCAADYRPMADDTIVVCCTTEPSDEDEDREQLVNISQILPADGQSGAGTVTHMYDDYGVLDEDIYFTEMGENYAVGVYLAYTAVPCLHDEFKWRCVTTKMVDKPDKSTINSNNREYLDNPENYNDRNGLAIANREELFFRLYTVLEEAEKKIIIANTGDTPYRLLNLWFHSDKGRPMIRPRSTVRPTLINPHSQIEIRIHVKAQFICNYEEFAIAQFNKEMQLVVPVKVAVGSDEVVRSTNVRERQYQANRIRVKPDEPVNPNLQIFRAPRASRKFVDVRIKPYHIPPLTWEFMIGEPQEFEEKCAVEYPFLAEPLSEFNYKERLHVMVYIAEAYLKKCFRVYDMKDLQFEREGELFCLRLENLAESRPSVLLEDTVVVQDKESNTMYTGSIKKIYFDRVLFEFHEQLAEQIATKRFHVSFRYNRNPFQKLHHALDEMEKKYGEEFLFPEKVEEKAPLVDWYYECAEDETDPKLLKAPLKKRMPNGEMVAVPWQNPDLNWHQKRAIVNALRGECRPLPHLICGPPGTGKTSTLVELVLQQFLNDNQSHILVCTPSNSAANLILEKLIQSDQLLRDHFLRVIGFQVREREGIPEELMPYCGTVEKGKDGTEGLQMSVLENGFRDNCQMEYLCNFRIIVLTIGSVGTFMEMGFPDGHFTHLCVDEAGQCLETEVLIPMTLLNKATGHTVLVGDEKQLGPVVQFHPLVKWNYGVSLFERLQQFPLYNRDNAEHYDQRLCYQLVNNYRSLPRLLKIYNRLFYNDTLKPMILDETEVEYECLRTVSTVFPPSTYRTKNAAVFFYSVKTPCKRIRDNPSWINPGECASVCRFYKNLLDCGVSAMDVGIISPYQEQVRVIRSAIDVDGVPVPKIGSVEEFQGQERMIILISTVRSKRRCEDKQFGLGFVNHPKRINVALSRARALLVVFGNALVLGEDPNWKSILINCQKEMSYFEEEPVARK